jgi:hypothetical protein
VKKEKEEKKYYNKTILIEQSLLKLYRIMACLDVRFFKKLQMLREFFFKKLYFDSL